MTAWLEFVFDDDQNPVLSRWYTRPLYPSMLALNSAGTVVLWPCPMLYETV